MQHYWTILLSLALVAFVFGGRRWLLTIPPYARLALWFAIMAGLGGAFYLLHGHPHA